MTTKCQCEANRQHHKHVGQCKDDATVSVKTIYGTLEMCQECADEFPEAYLVGKQTSRNLL